MRKFYFFLAAMCCAVMSLVSVQSAKADAWKPSAPQSGYRKYVEGLLYGTTKMPFSKKDPIRVLQSSNGETNYSHISGEIVIKSKVRFTHDISFEDVDHDVTMIGGGAFYKTPSNFSIVCPSSITSIGAMAFSESGLTGIKINKEVTTISWSAFEDCADLKSINIPAAVNIIEKRTFANCISLPAITLPNVEEIEESAFEGCTSLTLVNGGNLLCPVKKIGHSAFKNCTSLKNIRLASNKLTYIGYSAFKGCTGLESFVIPSSAEVISGWAFANSGLKVLYNNRTTPQNIDANVFEGVYIKNCILYVPKGCKAAYQKAKVWKEFGAILEPGEQPATGAIAATGIYKIGDLYYHLNEDRTAKLVYDASYDKLSGDITVPETVFYSGCTYTVTSMGGVFINCAKLTSVTLPNTITEIRGLTFLGCKSLSKVTLPTSLTSIGYQAFASCPALTTINLPATLTHLGERAFAGCTSLASEIRIPGGVDTIPEGCFENCSKVTNIILLNGVKRIENQAFAGTGITSITLPATVSALRSYIFKGTPLEVICCEGEQPAFLEGYNCVFDGKERHMDLYVPGGSKNTYKMANYWRSFRNIYEKGIPEKLLYGDLYYQLKEDFTAYVTYETDGNDNYSYLSNEVTVLEKVRYKGMYYTVTEIGEKAFRGATGITKINLPKNLKEIGGKAFSGCKKLAEVNIPYTVQILAKDAFEDTQIYYDNKYSDGAVYYDGCLLTLFKELPSDYTVKVGIRLIATWVFDGQPVTSLTLPEGLQVLCNGALSDMADLQTVTLPASLNQIGESFLHNCYALKDIYNYNPNPYDLSNVYCFDGVNKGACTLHVPYGSKSQYQAAEVWKDFNIVEMPAEYTVDFYDLDYNLLKTETVKDGEAAHAPEAPEREGYQFTGWDQDFSYVHSDLVVTPEYAINSYTVHFLDYVDNIVETQNVEYGESAEAPLDPERSGYTFIGWDKDFSIVKADIDIRPRFIENAKIWTVTYIDNDKYGAVELYKELVEDGQAAQGYPAAHEGYKLWYWLDDDTWEHADLSSITKDMVVQAYYTEITFHVTFRVNGVQTYEINAIYGYDPSDIYYPYGTPTRESTEECDYEFIGWTPDVDRLLQDMTFEAEFEAIPHTYTITWQDDEGATIDQTVVEYGDTPMHPDEEKASTAEYTYTFAGWSPAIVSATEDATYKATFDAAKNSYTITWLNEDESLLGQTVLEYGETPAHAALSKAGDAEFSYSFAGWDPEIKAVTGDASYKATFNATKNSYTVSWLKEDGSLIDKTVVEYGVMPEHDDAEKAESEDYTYTFTGWIPALAAVSGDANYVATFEAVSKQPETAHTIKYLDKDADELKKEGIVLHLPEAPVVSGFTFVEWRVVEGTIDEGIVVRAAYNADGDATELPDVLALPGNSARKLVRDGVVYILQDDHTYTIQGQKVK